MKAKYNWKELRKEWYAGNYANLTDFANKHNIPHMALIHIVKCVNESKINGGKDGNAIQGI